MKKTYFNWLVAVFCMLASTVSAANCGICDPCAPCTCECEPCNFEPPCPPSVCAYNAPQYVDIACAWDVFASVSYLYWQAKEDGLEIGSLVDFSTVNNISTEIVPMDFDYSSAFKVGLGFNFCNDNWQIIADYTWYNHDNKNTKIDTSDAAISDDIFFNTQWMLLHNESLNLQNFNLSDSLSGKWDLSFNKLDVALARPFYVGQCLTMRAAYGLRGLWITQKMNVQFAGTSGTVTTIFLEGDLNQKLSTWAVGPKLGLNTNWNYCNGFRFFGNFDFAILYSDIDRTISNSYVRTPSTGPVLTDTFSSTTNDICFLRPQAGFEIGLGWGDYFCCNSFYMDFTVGYEAQVYWSENSFVQGVANPGDGTTILTNKNNTGNLYLHGLTVTARIDF